MPSAEIIISMVQKIRSDLNNPRVKNPEVQGWGGFCGVAETIAQEVADRSQTWLSPTMQSPPGAYAGHRVAVVPGEFKPQCFIVDFTVEKPILGIISDGSTDARVAEALSVLTGVSDWRKTAEYKLSNNSHRT